MTWEEDKEQQLLKVYDQWASCERCKLSCPKGRTRHNVVFGSGWVMAKVLIVGEGPGEGEDEQGNPFVGSSGDVLNGGLASVNAMRSEVFITNVVGCRPTFDDNPRRNRPPERDEIEACRPRLMKIIEIVDPFVILMLGDVAYKTVTGEKTSISKVAEDPNGLPLVFSTPGSQVPIQRTGFATYHPAHILRMFDPNKDNGLLAKFQTTFQRAFTLADMMANIYRGESLPERE